MVKAQTYSKVIYVKMQILSNYVAEIKSKFDRNW